MGRGFLYDAKLSGNGTGSCASCHIDGDMDHLAWDLGDPGGSVATIQQAGRGDRIDFAAFTPAFEKLMGGTQISTADMSGLHELY